MASISYTVIATLPTPAIADEYVRWLEDGHVDQVVRGGARSAMIVRLDAGQPGEPPKVMTQYVFPTREVFDTYVREHAPALRTDGLKRFGPERGIRMERMVGTVC